MAEAEDVITDVARHLTIYSQGLWRKHRPREVAQSVTLGELRRQCELLVLAVFGRSIPIKRAQQPVPPTLFTRVFRRGRITSPSLPATDGVSIFLPADAGTSDEACARDRYRLACLRQAARLTRGSAQHLPDPSAPLAVEIYLFLEALAADHVLARMLPGLVPELNALRVESIQSRTALAPRDMVAAVLESWVRDLLSRALGNCDGVNTLSSPEASHREAIRLSESWLDGKVAPGAASRGLKDWWSGELLRPEASARDLHAGEGTNTPEMPATPRPARSTKLARRPSVRAADEEQDERQGAFMVQTSQPHEHAEDPFGMNRPTDRDEETPLNEFAESLGELAEAQLVRTPERARDYFVSEDLPASGTAMLTTAPQRAGEVLEYPEWDYRQGGYRASGAKVHSGTAPVGPDEWVRKTLAAHAPALAAIRRRFEMLRAEPIKRRRQVEGDEIDIEACVARFMDLRSGRASDHGLYERRQRQDRDIAVSLLIDVSGSTDAWVSGNKRVIDVAREALLLVSIALERTDMRYAVQAFSGESRQGVVVREIKRFDELHGPEIAQRIAGLEPEHSTRAGAALRHASTGLMKETAAHRLLLLLSDGRPNDVDEYEGRYGVEDTRQAVLEAMMQGVSVFCLTIDQTQREYLSRIFGRDYAMIREPARLPAVLLDWMKALISR